MDKSELLQAELECIEKVIMECYEYYSMLDSVDEELLRRYNETIEEVAGKKVCEMTRIEKEKYKYANMILNGISI